MLKHCPKCCPKRHETVHGVAGSTSHAYEPMDWDKTDSQHWRAVGPWGWRCENCGHFKKPRLSRKYLPAQ